jgi:hypothetical protein
MGTNLLDLMILAIRFYMENESVKFHKDIHNSAFIKFPHPLFTILH